MKQSFNAAVRILLALAAYFTSTFVLLGLLAAFNLVNRLRTDYTFLSSMNIVVGLALSGSTLLVYRLLDKGSPIRLGFGIRKKNLVFSSVVFAVSLIGASGFTFALSQDPGLNAQFHFGKLTELSFLLVLMLGWTGWLFSTMQEEVLNRGYFFANLNRLGPLRMILLSSFIFSLTHVMTKGFHPVPLLIHLVGGIGYGYVYLKSGSLWMSAVMHSLHNFFLDILFNNDYAVTLVTFSHKLSDADKLLQQIVIVTVIMLITYRFYGKDGVLTPAHNLQMLWREKASTKHSKSLSPEYSAI